MDTTDTQSTAQPVMAAAITPLDMPTPTAPAKPVSTQGAKVAGETYPLASAGATPAPAPIPSGELDSRGVPFDPARHLPRKHPRGGHWMPKGGRKPRAAHLPRFLSDSGSSAGSGAANSTATPPPSASFVPSERDLPADDTAQPVTPVQIVDHADDAAEVITRGAQFGAGLIFDDADAGKVTDGEHRNMTKATAAYIRTKGWQASAGVALALVFVAWVLKIVSQPGPQAKVKGWFAKGRAATPAAETLATEEAAKQTAQNAAPASSPGIPPLA